jgi:type I restriction enzyme S subunit
MSEEAHDDRASSGSTCKGWKAEELTHLVERIDYGHTASAVDAPSGPRFLRITDIQDEHVDWSSVPSCEIASREIDQYRLSPGDIVFARTGATTGKSYLIQKCPEAVFASYLIRLRLRPGILPTYLFHFFKSADYWGQINQKKKGTGQPGVNSTILATLRVPIAPANEQSRIVEALDSYLTRLDAATEGLKRVEANLRRYRTSVLKAAVEGHLVPTEAELAKKEKREYEPASVLLERILKERRHRWEQAELVKMKTKGEVPRNDTWKDKYEEPSAPDTSELPELPEGWCWASWAQIGMSQNGRPFPSSEYQQTGVRLLRPGNLHVSGQVVWNDENTRCLPERWADEFPSHLIHPGELVMNLTAQSLKDEFLGRVCITGPGERCLLNQRIARLHPVLVRARYLLWVFKSPVFRRFVDGLNTGSLIQHMFTSQLAECVLPLAPLAEQDRIVEKVEDALSVDEHLQETIDGAVERITRLRQSILRWAFEGKLVDQDPNDEPASVLLERIRRERESSQPVKPPKPERARRKSA